jgi:hypothetical protein
MPDYQVEICTPDGVLEKMLIVTANSVDFPPSGGICFTHKDVSKITGQKDVKLVLAVAPGRWTKVTPQSENMTLGSTS